ncbi:uncharacterized protein LOC110007218 [Amborella trichopoda]|uniref:uncharacterized protein LOC110007218 n=1 Tax=Amborella trichopoda TaxID=13333 RepID=UPI0009C0B3C9|nr:uncharacterized protein LOC110007218 [Amborella trichopoda]|eukprot:XP_020522608.1 uncharacterized protein LOC110007218 [Amborella trichopoda]
MKYMAFSRFICILLLGLLFATVELASSSVVALQVVALDKTQEIKVPIADENLAVQRGVMVESKGLKGRKMAMKETVMKKKTGAEDKNHVASRISGAIPSVGKHEHEGKGQYNVNCKMSAKACLPFKANAVVVLTSFSADYHMPDHHPPRNN